MDPRFRFDDHTEMLETLADDVLSRVRVAIPVKVAKDSDGKTVSLQPLIKSVQRAMDGSLSLVSLPVLGDVPIHYGGGGGVTITHPHKEGDEGIFLVSHRSLDAWHQQGGEQPQVDARMLSLSDGFYLPNVRSTPRELKNVSTTSTQVRSDDGKHVIDVNPTSGTITHSVEGGKHVSTVSRDNGITHSVDNGKHVVSLSEAGIAMKSAMAIAATASRGFTFTGAMKVDGKLTSSQSIGGGILNGALQGGLGAIVGTLLTLFALSHASGPFPATQTASYVVRAAFGGGR